MEENKFEKQVQQKMDELKIQPSDAVWKKIEVRIEKRKEHRWGLIILFLLIGITLCGGYWLWSARQQKFLGDNSAAKNSSVKDIGQTSVKENKNIQRKINPVSESTNENNNEGATIKQPRVENKNSTQNGKFLTPSRTKDKSNAKEKTSITSTGETEMIGDTSIETKASMTSSALSENVIDKPEDSLQGKVYVDSSSKSIASDVPVSDHDTAAQKEPNAAVTKKSNKNKWKFGILLSGGMSGVGSHFLDLNDAPVYAAPGALSSGQQTGFSSPGSKSAFAFLAGLFVERQISKRSGLVAGINFKSFNVSTGLNDSAGTYSSRSAANKYINRFNFIELPVSVKMLIGNEKKIPLYWQGGLVLSELINSNALQYNEYSGYYYQDNSIFNKTQFGFNTAFSVGLFPKQKTSILIGPYFYYNASKIGNEGLYNKKHFAFVGLQTQIIFHK